MTRPGWLTRRIGGMKLSSKLIAAFLVLALVPVTVVGVYAYFYMYNSMTRRVEDGMVSSIRQLQIADDDALARYEQVLNYLMYDQQMVSIFSEESVSYYDVYYNMREVYLPLLVTIRQMNEAIEQIGVYTDNQALRPRGSEVRPLEEVRDTDQVRRAMGSRGVEWDVEGDELVAMGPMLRLTRQSPDSVAYLRLPVETLLDFDPGNVFAWGIALTDGERVLAARCFGGFELTAERWTAVETGTVANNGRPMLVICQPLKRADWRIVFVCSYDELHIDMSSLVWMILLALAGSLGAMTVISLLISRSFTRRIRTLNDAMARVEKGALMVQPAVQPWERDEIAQLTTHFGNMLASLNDYIEINYKNQIVLRDAELRMLQAQINPHFLYNSLSMINWMALEHDELEISEVLMQLSQFYRMILRFSDGNVTVQDEVENITCYLELQSRLHENSFDVRLEMAEDIRECRMIGMVLQPVVENAIVHGLDGLRNRRGILEVTGQRDGDALVFRIRDNGPGMTREQFEHSLSQSSKGYGLKNVHDRLRIAYGPGYGLTMADTPDRGTTIEFRVPVKGDVT